MRLILFSKQLILISKMAMYMYYILHCLSYPFFLKHKANLSVEGHFRGNPGSDFARWVMDQGGGGSTNFDKWSTTSSITVSFAISFLY